MYHVIVNRSDGSEGFYNYTTQEIAQGIKSPYVDVMSDHLYPLTVDLCVRKLLDDRIQKRQWC